MAPLLGTNVSTSAQPGADPVGEASHAERLGFDFVSCSDHLHGRYPTFETWTMLAWIAASTSRVRVASNVLGMPYRPPAVLAKMAEALDRLSGGRLILGLGGGGSDEEFRAFGLPVRTPREKVDALEEGLHVIRGLWTETPFTFEGRHYHVREAELEPKPERPIPIWLGTYGDRAIALTGRLADGWIPSLRYAPPDIVPERMDRVRRAAEAAGRDPGALTFAYNVGIRVDEHADPRWFVVSGPPEACAERLRGFLDLGFTALNLWPAGPNPADQRERLSAEVAPLLR